MTRSTENPELVAALRLIQPDAELEDLAIACQDLFLESDLYCIALIKCSTKDVETISNAIFQIIVEPPDATIREIVLEKPHAIIGKVIEHGEFSHRYSSEILTQVRSAKYEDRDPEDLVKHLKMFLAAIFFRYRWCDYGDEQVFPVSAILSFTDAIAHLHPTPEKDQRIREATITTLLALESLETYPFRRRNNQHA